MIDRETVVIVIKEDEVDASYKALSEKGVEFIDKPTDMPGWESRVAHFRDPENNILEMYSQMERDKWDTNLQDEAKEYGY